MLRCVVLKHLHPTIHEDPHPIPEGNEGEQAMFDNSTVLDTDDTATFLEETTLSGHRFCDDQARQELAADGFLVVHGLTHQQDVVRVRQLIEPLFDQRVGFNEGRQFDMAGVEKDGDAPKLPQILAPRTFAPGLAQTEMFRNAHQLAHELLGPDATFVFDHVIKKPAHDGAVTPWHQDEAFHDPMFFYEEISIWVPLQAVNAENGCMQFIRGPGEVLPHGSPNNDTRVHVIECIAGFDPADAVACPLEIGSCTVHSGRTVHGAGANFSDAPRYAYIMVFENPRLPRTETRAFPWQAGEDSERAKRAKAWRRKGGYAVLAWRRIKRALVSLKGRGNKD
jgi:hypothetical protein